MDTTAHHEIPTAYYAVLFATVRLRDGPLEKLWVGGGGIFELHEFFFVNISLAGIFFSVCKNIFSGLL